MTKTYTLDKVQVQRLMLDRWGLVNQKLLCDRAGITEQTLIRMFKGKSFSSETLYKLCMALQCGPEDVLVIGPKDRTLVESMAA